MLTILSVHEVKKLHHLLKQVYLDTDQKRYDIMEELLYSYDKEKRKAKKEELHKCIVDCSRYLASYRYWDNLLGHLCHSCTTTPPYRTDFGTVDVDMNEVQQILTFLHEQLIDYTATLDTEEVSSAYHYWIRVSKGDNNEN